MKPPGFKATQVRGEQPPGRAEIAAGAPMKPHGSRATQVRGEQPLDIADVAAGAGDPREPTYHYEGARAGAEQRPNPRE